LRAYHGAVYDPTQDRMLVFGGLGVSGGLSDVWQLSLGDAPQWTRCQPAGILPYERVFASAVYVPEFSAMVVFGGFTPGLGIDTISYNDLWAISWQDTPTAVLVSLESATVTAGSVELRWYASRAPDVAANVYRSEGAAWERVASVSPDVGGRIHYVDTQVTPGARYGYRLGIVERGLEAFFGETWVAIPRGPTFALEGANPNPVEGEAKLRFSLIQDRPATLEIIDVTGRRVLSREVGSLGAGSHVVNVAQVLRPGVYLVRLRQGRDVAAKRMCVVE
jgi:hypothetical protein